MLKKKNFILIALIFVFFIRQATVSGEIVPSSLTCEHMVNPSVVDEMTPRLSWINMPSSPKTRGECQTAYRIVVASSCRKLSEGNYDMWDSGKVPSSDSYLVLYKGKALQSAMDCWWKVKVWNRNGKESAWSKTSCWGMGLLGKEDWKAKWIGAPWQGEEPQTVIGLKSKNNPSYPAPLFRKTFSVKKKILSAKAFVTGLGYFEFYINGKKAGKDVLVPNFTNYTVRSNLECGFLGIDGNKLRDYRVMYLVYDITSLLRKGKNTAGAVLGNGFYDCTSIHTISFGSPRFLCQIEIKYADGTKDRIVTDETWNVKKSPLLMNDVYGGEIYDANKETERWCLPDCKDTDWFHAKLRTPPSGQLTAHTAPTDKITGSFSPVSFKKQKDGSYEVDFGKEISGWIRLKGIQGRKGDTLEIKYLSESPQGIEKYIFKGKGKESYAPRFTWFAFRKAVIRGIKNLSPYGIKAEAVNTDVKLTAEFSSSDTLFNKINAIWQRSELDNLHGGIASDCPHRERCPYTGDGQVSCITVMDNFDAAAFYRKWIRDMRDSQNTESGYLPNSAPWLPTAGGGLAWGAAMNIIPWEYYLHYGDKEVLEENYFAMKEQVRYMLSWLTKDGTISSEIKNLNPGETSYWLNLGEWAPAFKFPQDELIETFYFWQCADFTAKAAKALGHSGDYAFYSILADKTKKAFDTKFYNVSDRTYGDFGSNIFALVMGVPKEKYDGVINTLRKEIEEKYKGHLNTGVFGTRFFFQTLAANGMNELAFEAMNKTDFPSYGAWVKKGATTTWEQWNGSDSHNHPMFGGGLTWFYSTLAGVNPDENEPGFRHIIIRPVPVKKLNKVSYSNICPYGKIISEIRQRRNILEMDVTIPVGSYGSIFIPVGSKRTLVTESGKKLEADIKGIKILGYEDGYLKIEVKQGSYRFEVQKKIENKY